MYLSKLMSLFTAFIVTLFGWFPGSELISSYYASFYDWEPVEKSLSDAVESFDSQALVLMASPEMKNKYPDLKEKLDSMFSQIKGNIRDFTVYSDNLYESRDFQFRFDTTEGEYSVEVYYTAVDAASKQTELGIKRIMMKIRTDEYRSRWIAPEHYMAVDYEDEKYTSIRTWCCGNGADSDEYVFLVEDKGNDVNVRIGVTRNNVDGIPDPGYPLREGDELKIYFIPEGEEPPAPGTRTPDAVVRKDDSDESCYYSVKPDRYYLYVEPSDNEMYYTVSVQTMI